MAFIKSGIEGLDEILKGGIQDNSSILVVGTPGTGKSIMALQYVLQGAREGQAGIYITAEESVASIRDYATSLGLELDEYEKKGVVTLMRQRITGRKILTLGALTALMKKKRVRRVVLDSITLFKYGYEDRLTSFRKEILDFLELMKDSKATLLCTSEKSVADLDKLRYDAQEFLFDGVIVLMKIRKGSSFERVITIQKMRGQDHMIDIFPFTISSGGIKIHRDQLPFSLIDKDFRSAENG